MKVLIATEKPFAPVAVQGIKDVIEAGGHEKENASFKRRGDSGV